MGRHARIDTASAESSHLTDRTPAPSAAQLNLRPAPPRGRAGEQPANDTATYVGRRSRASAEALSVADLRERMAIESLRRADPVAAPLVAGALAAARVAPSPVAAGTAPVAAPSPVPPRSPRRAPGQPIVAPRPSSARRVLGQPVVAPAKPVSAPRPSAPRPVAPQPVTVQPVTVQPVTVQPVTVQPVTVQPVTVQPVTVQLAPVAPMPPVAPVAAPAIAAAPAPTVQPVDLLKPAAAAVAEPVVQPVVEPAPRSTSQGGRRRASRATGPSVFRVPAATTPTPGSRAALARRRATATSRRRPLLLSTPIIAAALIVGTSIGGERGTSASTAAATIARNADGTTGLGQSDIRVSRKTREEIAATDTAAATPTDTAAAETVPLNNVAEPAPPAAPVAALPGPAGGAPAAVPETPVSVPPPPPAATWVRPVEGGSVTSCFCTRWGTFHDGIDIDPRLGTPIVSVGDGTVVFAGPVSGYGIGIYIQHLDGSVSFYGHMAVYYVRTGDVVTTGQEIALVGNEGYSTGPHLHFSVFTSWTNNGLRQNAIDPITWLADRGVTFGS